MEKQKSSPSPTQDREVVMSRLVDAPRELVFEVFTDPKHVVHWWGPRNFTNTIHEMDVRPGGIWRWDMNGWGQSFPSKVVYKEVIKPERLVFIHGNDVPNMEDDEATFEQIITFEAKGKKTLVTMKAVFRTAEYLQRVIKENHAIEGGKQTMDKLEEYLLTVKE
jgi:uncharacterized protein YndB with AHSA1/START domain